MTKMLQAKNESHLRHWQAIMFLTIVFGTLTLNAQTLNVLHSFSNGADGSYPIAGVTIAQNGTVYGTTAGLIFSNGGPSYGNVFKLTQHNGTWIFAPLYNFSGGSDGRYPASRVIIGSNGTLYGVVNRGGNNNCQQGCGLVFNLHPRASFPPTPLTPWNETVLYEFQGGADGAYPGYGDLVFDQAGNIYDTASQGGINNCANHIGCGVVYKLTPSGGSYSETAIYAFTGGSDGAFPLGSAAFDHSGNLYTTAYNGGINNNGTVIELTPSGGNYTETTIHQFAAGSDGYYPWTGVIVDGAGNLYGTSSMGGTNGGGVAYELMPSGQNFTFDPIEEFTGSGQNPGPRAALTTDASGNLYGTTYAGGAHGFGLIFKLTPSGGGYSYSDLYDFTGGNDGANPASNVVLDSSGNLYGTAYQAGAHGFGVVWQLAP